MGFSIISGSGSQKSDKGNNLKVVTRDDVDDLGWVKESMRVKS